MCFVRAAGARPPMRVRHRHAHAENAQPPAKLLHVASLPRPNRRRPVAHAPFQQQRIGYLGLMILLDERHEVLMLVTNSLKMDLNNHKNMYIVGLALAALGNICSAGAARRALWLQLMNRSSRRGQRPWPTQGLAQLWLQCCWGPAALCPHGRLPPPPCPAFRDGAGPGARRRAPAGGRQPLHPQEGGAVRHTVGGRGPHARLLGRALLCRWRGARSGCQLHVRSHGLPAHF